MCLQNSDSQFIINEEVMILYMIHEIRRITVVLLLDHTIKHFLFPLVQTTFDSLLSRLHNFMTPSRRFHITTKTVDFRMTKTTQNSCQYYFSRKQSGYRRIIHGPIYTKKIVTLV